MAMRLDHVMIVVPDLDTAKRRYEQLGFRVTPGGRHTGIGTHNAIIRFGLDYLELLAVYNEEEASQSPGSRQIKQFADTGGGAFIYALATADIEADLAAAAARGAQPAPARAMERKRPDGTVLSWKLADIAPMAEPPNRPFLIQWTETDVALAARYQREGEAGVHPNGATAWKEIVVGVPDVTAAERAYKQAYNLDASDGRISLERGAIRLAPGHGIRRLVIQADRNEVIDPARACGVEIELRAEESR